MSKSYAAASCSRVRWTSSTMGSSHMTLCSHEFFRRTDDWHSVPQLLTDHCYSPSNLCICQVLAIPCEQIINRVNSRYRDVRGVTNGVRRKHARSHDGPGQRLGVPRDFERRQAADDCKSLLHLRWVTG